MNQNRLYFLILVSDQQVVKIASPSVQSTSLIKAEVAYTLTTKEPILLLCFNICIIFVLGQWLMNIIIIRQARDLPPDLYQNQNQIKIIYFPQPIRYKFYKPVIRII